MRALSSSVMAVLVIAALFWGNCFSCPQMFQSLHQPDPSHGCCHHSKKTSSQDCSSQSLRNFVKADPAAHDATAATPVVVTAPAPAFIAEHRAQPVSAAHTPPDLLSLHASFRI